MREAAFHFVICIHHRYCDKFAASRMHVVSNGQRRRLSDANSVVMVEYAYSWGERRLRELLQLCISKGRFTIDI